MQHQVINGASGLRNIAHQNIGVVITKMCCNFILLGKEEAIFIATAYEVKGFSGS